MSYRNLRRPLGLLIFLVLWQAVSLSGLVSSELMPGLGTIGAAIAGFVGQAEFWTSFFATVQRMLIGLIVAVALALLLAVIAGRYPVIRRMLLPITDIMRSLPPPALVPLLIFVLGIGPPLFYFIVIYGCMWPTYISASNALATAEPVQVSTGRSFGLTDWQIMWQIRVPAALPEAFTGIRLSAGISLLATVATEMLVGGSGLGALIFDAGFSLLWDDMYALMFIIGMLGIAMNQAVHMVRQPLAGWQSSYSAMGAQT
ncbi:ABC transporter permease [Paracoccus sp. (in: a-proteobacteria)]|uniref:ABC transporter permease n=1 Tax=Paracoccus sp. TaxID=267 RepID=UPI003A85F268